MYPCPESGLSRAGAIVVDAGSRRVSIDGVLLHLTPIEYRLLEHLVREAGRVVSRDELLSAARQRDAEWHDRALDVHVSHLRAKLNGRRDAIRTVRGLGYVFGLNTAGGAEAPPVPYSSGRGGTSVPPVAYEDAGSRSVARRPPAGDADSAIDPP